jgi:hypothetical protein
MNLQLQDINRTFVYNKGMILHEKTQTEIARKQQEQAEIRRAENSRRKQQSLVNSIQSHFKNLEKFVKEVFAEPSELSRFLIEKVLSVPGCRLISRQKFVEGEPMDDDYPTLVSGSTLSVTSGHFEKEYFDSIDLVRIESLSNEKSEYFVALIVPNIRALGNEPRNDLRDMELVVYAHKNGNYGFESDEEDQVSHPPANVELRDTLKYLKDLNVFCQIILKKYQHLITS